MIGAVLERGGAALLANISKMPRLGFEEWGERFLENGDGTPFKFRPQQRLPAAAMFDPRVQHLALRWYSGAGKTFLLGAGFCYGASQLREEMAIMLPNATDAEDWCKNELWPMVEATPVMRRLELDGKGADLLRLKRWKNGSKLTMLGANSASRLRRLQAGVLYADEIDGITSEESDEGDKLRIYWKRGRGRQRVHKWASSYPSVKGQSKIDALFEEPGTVAASWFFECPRCNHHFQGHTSQVVHPAGQPEKSALECPECGRGLSDRQRYEMALEGWWQTPDGQRIEEPPDGKALALHLNCIAHVGDWDESYASYLHVISAEMAAAAKSENPDKARRVFVNTMDAESFKPKFEEKPEGSELHKRREPYKPAKEIPEGVVAVVIGADVQKDRIEAEVVGLGLNEETWGLGYYVLHGSPLQDDVWDAFDALRERTWKRPDGHRLFVRKAGVDSGHWQDAVLAYARTRHRAGVMALKGSSTLGKPLIGKASKVGNPPTPQYQVGTNEAKDLIYQRLELEPPEDADVFPTGYMHFPRISSYNDRYFSMLTAEDSKLKRGFDGDFYRSFECPKGIRNEALDCRVYAMAVARAARLNLKAIARKLEGKPPEKPKEKAKKGRPVKRKVGWVGGW